MGICITREESKSSCDSNSSRRRSFVGAIIVFGEEDGDFRRVESGTRVQRLLEEYPECIVCNCNEVVVGEPVRAMGMDDELRGGEVYFLLPKTRLHSSFNKADMAFLVSKANYAILTMPKFSFRKEEVVCRYYDDSGTGKVPLLQRSSSLSSTPSAKFVARPVKWSSKLSPIVEGENSFF